MSCKSLPGTDARQFADTVKLDDKTLANLKPVGSAIDDGTQGRASIDFPATTGRYVMLRWSPASHADTSFTVAEVSAFGPERRKPPRFEPEFLQRQPRSAQLPPIQRTLLTPKTSPTAKTFPEEARSRPRKARRRRSRIRRRSPLFRSWFRSANKRPLVFRKPVLGVEPIDGFLFSA